MAEEKMPSFGWLVVARAWRGVLDTFDATWQAILLAAVLTGVSLAIQFIKNGWAAMVAEWGNTFLYSVLPVLLVGGAILLWNLWLAPSALAFEEARKTLAAASSGASGQQAEEHQPNFNPIKARKVWSVGVIAEALAGIDPDARKSRGTHQFSYAATVIDAMKNGELKYIKVPVEFHPGHFLSPSQNSQSKKEDALDWIERTYPTFDTGKLK